MNVEALRKVQDRIRKDPLTFNIDSWASNDECSPCGTTACIAGWAWVDQAKEKLKNTGDSKLVDMVMTKQHDIVGCARDALDLTTAEGNRLFFSWRWPTTFREEYVELDIAEDNTTDRKVIQSIRLKKSDLAVRRIEHFITTGE